ncbi:hypothetical protein [Jannaschia aquimarina]|uniref:Uncharacterized protein n=1 Tax=Jannaschia aquimarina TaxID=935700 RepID=A0A0D1E9X4_9RHOB|nr:hypothetical protein [Jannaschia aquimarina]KIT14489.1 hypothetical protein jaqu_37790 [Jannaschia aquimarina]SNT28648.1 hypothetical protein SAMN05421775_11020 [Jannaschia aquimarina]
MKGAATLALAAAIGAAAPLAAQVNTGAPPFEAPLDMNEPAEAFFARCAGVILFTTTRPGGSTTAETAVAMKVFTDQLEDPDTRMDATLRYYMTDPAITSADFSFCMDLLERDR